jgi:hypothetical protein
MLWGYRRAGVGDVRAGEGGQVGHAGVAPPDSRVAAGTLGFAVAVAVPVATAGRDDAGTRTAAASSSSGGYRGRCHRRR